MILFKRIFPFLLIALIWLTCTLWDNYRQAKDADEEERVARVTAEIWVATALFRDDPERYAAYRDSVLNASGVPKERVLAFLEQRGDKAEALLPFARRVQYLVDSLAKREDSIVRADRIAAYDSIRVVDSVPAGNR